MIDLDVLKKRGCSPEQLATVFKKFDLDVPVVNPDDTDRHTKLCNLRNRIRTRIQSGRDWNFANYKTYHALDLAWNTPFRQISPTLWTPASRRPLMAESRVSSSGRARSSCSMKAISSGGRDSSR